MGHMAGDYKTVSLGWTDRDIPIGTHMCFYYSDDRTLKETLSFLRVGLDEPETCCVLFADSSRFDSLLGWLSDGYEGSLDPLLDSNKLMVIGGAPTTAELLATIGGRLDQAMAEGFRVIRFLGFIGWGKPGWPDEASLLEFERTVNDVVTAYPAVIICTYGVPHLSGASLIYGGLQTHPVTMIGDDIRPNPHYRR
jgi:hypothetical protein